MASIIISTQSNDYTLTANDAGLILLTKSTTQTITVPKNDNTAIDVGTFIHFQQNGTGQTVFKAGRNVVIQSSNGLKMRKKYGVAVLIKIDTDTWVLSGDVTA